MAHELGLREAEILNMPSDEFFRWRAYFKLVAEIKRQLEKNNGSGSNGRVSFNGPGASIWH